MKTGKWVVTLAVACGLGAVAAEYPEYTQGMQSAGKAMGELSKMETKTGAKAMEAAEEIAVVNENLIGFWRQRNAAEAVKLSEQGKAAALELANAAYAGDNEKAAAALKRVSETCHNCHEGYREKSEDGKFQFKNERDWPRPNGR